MTTEFLDRGNQLFAFPLSAEMRYESLSAQRSDPMSKPSEQRWRQMRSRDVQVSEVHNLLDTLRTLDRALVQVFMNIYQVPLRDRAAMVEQHRRLHDAVRQQVPRLLCLLEKVK